METTWRARLPTVESENKIRFKEFIAEQAQKERAARRAYREKQKRKDEELNAMVQEEMYESELLKQEDEQFLAYQPFGGKQTLRPFPTSPSSGQTFITETAQLLVSERPSDKDVTSSN